MTNRLEILTPTQRKEMRRAWQQFSNTTNLKKQVIRFPDGSGYRSKSALTPMHHLVYNGLTQHDLSKCYAPFNSKHKRRPEPNYHNLSLIRQELKTKCMFTLMVATQSVNPVDIKAEYDALPAHTKKWKSEKEYVDRVIIRRTGAIKDTEQFLAPFGGVVTADMISALLPLLNNEIKSMQGQ